jgi:hypothetical protein
LFSIRDKSNSRRLVATYGRPLVLTPAETDWHTVVFFIKRARATFILRRCSTPHRFRLVREVYTDGFKNGEIERFELEAEDATLIDLRLKSESKTIVT